MLKAIFFDMDGTILTSIAAAERVWARWAERHGLDVERFLPTIHGKRAVDTVRVLAADAVEKVGNDHPRAEKACVPCRYYLDTGEIRLVKVFTGIDVRGRPGSGNAEGKQYANSF